VETDFELLDRWQAGDAAAGNALFQRHFTSICRFFNHKVGDARDELIQRTFLECLRSLDRFRKQSSFRTYLFSIARHQLFKYLRSRRHDAVGLDFTSVSLADLGTTPTGRLARNQQRGLLLRALHVLPLEQQVLLELHYWEGMDVPELVDVLEIAPAAVRMRLSRARHALRDRMESMSAGGTSAHASVDALDKWARSLSDEVIEDEQD
jgi:RNA polymerase sigma factor (sigma-70 family)